MGVVPKAVHKSRIYYSNGFLIDICPIADSARDLLSSFSGTIDAPGNLNDRTDYWPAAYGINT